MHGTYLYCLVRRTRKPVLSRVPPGLPGAEPPALANVEGDVWMVTADVPLERYGPEPLETALKDLDWVTAVALAHEGVIEHVVRMPGAVVIPMKLFTMFSTEARAAAEMRRRKRTLDRVFDRIAGCEEWGVRVLRGDGRAAPKKAAKPESGAAFLAARKQARDESRRAARDASDAADAAYASLSALARDGRRRPADTAAAAVALLDAAFLVPSRQRARFHAAAARIAKDVRDRGARMTLTGPWPPYNFVSADGQS
jgi:hypothetical protein